MYYVIKCIQAVGLTLILIGFLKNFPELMDMKMFAIGIIIFAFGWGIQRILLRK